MYKLRTGSCGVCGTYTERRLAPGRQLVCVSCTVDAAARSAREMHHKRGEAWTRWQAAMRDYLAGELTTRG